MPTLEKRKRLQDLERRIKALERVVWVLWKERTKDEEE